MKLTDFDVLTFDCYGTLIDWETGILNALRPLTRSLPSPLTPDQILEAFASEESAQEAETPTMLYRDVLRHVHDRLADRWGIEASEAMASNFGASVPDWPAFDDSTAALRYLAEHFKLVVLSNIDHTSFAGSQKRLKVDFDAVYTAEDIGSYKPDPRNFAHLIERLDLDFGIPRDKILHTAQSLFHDHVPAEKLGLARAWIDRRHDREGWGATAPPPVQPRVDFHFESMADLATAHQQALDES